LLTLDYDFVAKKDRVEPKSFEAYRKARREADDALSLVLYNRDPRKLPTMMWLWPTIALTLLASLGAVFVVQRYQPYLRRPRVAWRPMLKQHSLLTSLLAVGVTAAPVFLAKAAFTELGLFTPSTWARLTEPDSPAFKPYYAPLLSASLVIAIALTIGHLYVAYLFWVRSRTFPLAFVVLIALGQLSWIVSVATLQSLGTLTSATTAATVVGVVVRAAWIFYVLRSERIKAMFLPEPESDAAPAEA
jgi:hypothetical protein